MRRQSGCISIQRVKSPLWFELDRVTGCSITVLDEKIIWLSPVTKVKLIWSFRRLNVVIAIVAIELLIVFLKMLFKNILSRSRLLLLYKYLNFVKYIKSKQLVYLSRLPHCHSLIF